MAWCADEDQVAVKRLCSVESGRLVLSLGDSGKGCVEATKVSLAAIGPSRARPGGSHYGAVTATQEVWFSRGDLRVVLGRRHECPVLFSGNGEGLGLEKNLGLHVGSIV